jgi:hypothetical protein
MGFIQQPSHKNIELIDLEAHVLLSTQRRDALEEKIKRVEDELKYIEDQQLISRRLFVGSIVSILTGILSTAIAVMMRFHT